MRFRKYMAALTLAGIFLAGLGTGIGFVEYSGFEYGGSVVFGEEEREEERLVWELGSARYDRLCLHVPGVEQENLSVEKDEDVPRDEIWLDVSYNEKYGKPVLAEQPEDMDMGGGERIRTACIWYDGFHNEEDLFLAWMKAKDRILKELKEGKLSRYHYSGILSVEVRVNPENYGLFSWMY